MVAPCKEEQRSRAVRQACNRVRSALTQQVSASEADQPNTRTSFRASQSGQLRFPGSILTLATLASAAASLGKTINIGFSVA
jgi:hypothetical protein